MVHAKLDSQLFGNSILAPLGMVAADATNQLNVVAGDRRSSGFARAPTPIALEATPVPCDYGLRLDGQQGRTPIGPHLRQSYPKHSFLGLHIGALLAAGIGGKLLSQSEVFDDK
jgi:hypothetical protein